jgi:hypothetical protein
VNSRLTVYVSDLSASSSVVELIKANVYGAMLSGQLAETNDAIIQLVYFNESEKEILFIPSVVSDSSTPSDQDDWPMVTGVVLGAGILVVSFLLLVIRQRMNRDSEDIQRVDSISSFDHSHLIEFIDSSGHVSPSNLSSPVEDSQEVFFDANELYVGAQPGLGSSEQNSSFRDFVDERHIGQISFALDSQDVEMADDIFRHDEYIHDPRPHRDLTLPNPANSALVSYLSETSFDAPFTDVSSEYDGRVNDSSMICSICNKSMEGMPRKFCACGKDSCNLSAHTTCVLEKYPLPSVSHPGTPPTMLPVVLCRYKPKT